MHEIWSFQLRGAFRARQGERTVSRFRTQKTAAPLATWRTTRTGATRASC